MYNLSDGKSDGILLLYRKDGKIYNTMIPKNEMELLDIAMVVGLTNLTVGIKELTVEIKDKEAEKKKKADKLKVTAKQHSEYEKLFEKLWKLYPEKKGKASIKISKKKELFKYGYVTIAKCIQRYKRDVEAKRKDGFHSLKYQNGSTFFNKGFIDYLDENFEASGSVKNKANNDKLKSKLGKWE